MTSITTFRSHLKAIENGDFENFDFAAFTDIFQTDPLHLGDHLQYSLYKFCKEVDHKELEMTVIKLSELCFSKESVQGFNNMDRFLGSLFYVCNYFIKKKKYSIAMAIIESVKYKKTDIGEAATKNQSTRNFLYVLHSHFIAAAQGIALEVKDCNNDKDISLSYQLAETSIKFLELMKSKQLDIGKKIFRNFKMYFSNLKFYNKRDIYKLYRNVEQALINLMPMYEENDFVMHYVIKMDQLKGSMEMEVDDLNSYFKMNVCLVCVFINDLKAIKYWELIFSTDIKNEKYFRNFIGAISKLVTETNGKIHSLMFSVFFNHITLLWMKMFSNNWGEVFSSKMVQNLYNGVILPMKNSIGKSASYCRLIEYHINICFSDLYVTTLLRLVHIIRICLKNDVSDCLNLVEFSCESFKIIKTSLNEMKKQCCYSQKNQCWNNMMIQYTNMVEALARLPNSATVWTYIKDCCEQLVCELIASKFTLPYEWKRVKLLFQRWHHACLKLREFEEALFVCAFYAISYPREEEEALSMWVKTKTSMTSEVAQSFTFKDVIDREGERIKCMNPKFESSEQSLKKLLMKELVAYSLSVASNEKNWQSIADLIIKLWEMLKKFDLQVWERASLLNHVIIAAISSADSGCVKKYKKECEDVINEITKSQKSRSCRSLLHTANLKYSLFLFHLKSVQDAESKMDESKSVLEFLKKEEEERVKFGELVDVNLTCDVMPSSEHFTVAFEEKYISTLNETLEMWEQAAETVQPTSLEPYEFSSWLHNIKQVSLKYSLIGDTEQSFLSWILYYRIAKISNNRPCILLGLSRLVPEYSNLENSVALKEGEKIADNLMTSSKDKDALADYWLAVASNYLRNRSERRCFDYLQKIKDVLDCVKSTTGSYVYHARYWCLVSKFLCLYPEYMEKFDLKPNTELRLVAFRAFRYANNAVKDGSICGVGSLEYSETLLTMLDVNIWSYQLFGVYYQAAFMRFFLDDLYQIFQKLVLPTRTAYILLLLAQVDVMCEKIDDGTTKLISLRSILGTSSLDAGKDACTEKKKSEYLKVPVRAAEMESPRALSPARFLNVSDSLRERDLSPMQLVLSEKDDVSKRLLHAPRCSCYACRNLLIKFLYVNALVVEAELHQLNGLSKKSCVCYREGYENLKKLESFRIDLSDRLFGQMSKFANDLCAPLDFQCDLVKGNSIQILNSYALFMLAESVKQRQDFTDDVEKLIAKIDKKMTDLAFEQKLLQWKVMELKLVSFEVREMKNREREEKKEIPSPELKSPERMPMKTPLNPKKTGRNLMPSKYQRVKRAKSPNLFVSKPSGRKIFTEGEEEEEEECAKPVEVPPQKEAAVKPKIPAVKERFVRPKPAEAASVRKKPNLRKRAPEDVK